METNNAKAASDFDKHLVGGNTTSDFLLDAESIIMVIGVGGAGGNAVNHMQQMGSHGVNFVVCKISWCLVLAMVLVISPTSVASMPSSLRSRFAHCSRLLE